MFPCLQFYVLEIFMHLMSKLIAISYKNMKINQITFAKLITKLNVSTHVKLNSSHILKNNVNVLKEHR